MARTTAEQPHPLDVALGSRVRLRRKGLGLSQAALAGLLGLTFQQVQKYETGANRISFSRLMEMAQALESSASDLISGLDGSKSSTSRSRQIALLTATGASDLIEAYAGIKSLQLRRMILNLSRELANGQSDGTRKKGA